MTEYPRLTNDSEWSLLLDIIRYNHSLKSLTVVIAMMNPNVRSKDANEFVAAMKVNTTLTGVKVQLHHHRFGVGAAYDSLQYMPNLYTRRNRLKQVLQEEQFSVALLPNLLTSLRSNKSLIFFSCVDFLKDLSVFAVGG